MRKRITEIIQEQLSELHLESAMDDNGQVHLYGEKGALDSLALVNLIVAVETEIADEFSQVITLADEKALSQRNSPFRTIGSLAEYIESLLQEDDLG